MLLLQVVVAVAAAVCWLVCGNYVLALAWNNSAVKTRQPVPVSHMTVVLLSVVC